MMKSLQVLGTASALACAVLLGGALNGGAQAGDVATSVKADQLPKGKRTSAGLYVTSKDAAVAMAADSDAVFLDVRTIPEVVFVGAPVDAYNVPFLRFVTSTVMSGLKTSHAMAENKGFAPAVEALMTRLGKDKSTTLFVMCRSGGRSAGAVNVLHKLGYTKAYSVVDGFEGGKDKASGMRTVSGWRNSGLAWTYRQSKDHAYQAPAH